GTAAARLSPACASFVGAARPEGTTGRSGAVLPLAGGIDGAWACAIKAEGSAGCSGPLLPVAGGIDGALADGTRPEGSTGRSGAFLPAAGGAGCVPGGGLFGGAPLSCSPTQE